MHKHKRKFIPLLAALAMVLCGPMALAAGAVNDSPEAPADDAVVISEGRVRAAWDIDTVAIIRAQAEDTAQALDELTLAARQFDLITAAVEGTTAMEWASRGCTVGRALDIMSELIERRNEICENVKYSRTLIERSSITAESAQYAQFINAGVRSLDAVETLALYQQEIREAFEGYDLYAVKVHYEGDFKLTGYCPCPACCGIYSNMANPVTASGTVAQQGRTIAMSGEYEFGTVVYIDGLGLRTVEDRGGAIKGNKIDVYMDSHSACMTRATNRVAATYIIETDIQA
ncbi:MAG: 3D domain-containing protein [Oscillospiraceae bacterium]|nr:3D domain-containing protein [Oscillospiraceae bacterium]